MNTSFCGKFRGNLEERVRDFRRKIGKAAFGAVEDIVANADGLMVANRGNGKRAELNFSPAPQSLRAKYQRAPVLASE